MTNRIAKYVSVMAVSIAACPVPTTGTEPPKTSNTHLEFDRHVAPLLARRCLACHQGADPKGGLDLSIRERAMSGGESGQVLQPGAPENSVLWIYVDDGTMPPDHQLPDEEKLLLHRWIKSGAAWGTSPIDPFRYSSESRAGYDWWSLQSVKPRPIPESSDGWAENPIDRFIETKLNDSGLKYSEQADRRTLIRRVTIDLIGLPPTPDDVETFLADNSPLAYENLVDRLLASPRYGERWARHWLDVVRYGETNGFERNARRPDAWHYRDWVIDSLNEDAPYDDFAAKQIAGDALYPGDLDAIRATGFLVAGVHNTVLGNEQMRRINKQDELEDLIAAVGQTFLGLTVNCARCHDHKFDPISQRDYYRLASALSGVEHGPRDVPVPQVQAQILQKSREMEAIEEQIAAIDDPIRNAILSERRTAPKGQNAPELIASWDLDKGLNDLAGSMHLRAVGSVATSEDGTVLLGDAYLRSEPLPSTIREKTLEAWVKLENLSQQGGGVFSLQSRNGEIFDALVFGEQEPGHWLAGSNNFSRTKPFLGPPETEATSQFVHVVITYDGDGIVTAYRNGRPYGNPYKSDGLQEFEKGEAVALIGCRHEPAQGNRRIAATIRKARLYDRALSQPEVEASAATDGEFVSEREILARLTDGDRKARKALQDRRDRIARERKTLHSQGTRSLYIVSPQEPTDTYLLIRGDVNQPSDRLAPGGIQAVMSEAAQFGLDPDAPEASRRRKLANWVTHEQNPLFPRVAVNRLWHYHFGTGIVETTSDFGFNGGKPSHPELLDWLANEFAERQMRWKSIHRLIVTSKTYRQASRTRPEAIAKDSDNRLLWRKKPFRVEAEVLRDSMLRIAALLNDEYGGPSFSDYQISDANNGTAYYEPYDPIGPEFHRRSVYRFLPRGGNQSMLDVFDCPDCATAAPKRNTTTTPLQALSLWNGAFALRMAESLADRIAQSYPNIHDQVAKAYEWTLLRECLDAEADAATALVERHGLATLCRVLLNSNEFLTVD